MLSLGKRFAANFSILVAFVFLFWGLKSELSH